MKKRCFSRSLIGVLLVVFLTLFCAWAAQRVGRNKSSWETKTNFKTILSTLAAYSRSFDHLPFPVRRFPMNSTEMFRRNGQGEPLYSWRVEVVSGLVSWPGSWDRSQPWDSPANRELLEVSGFFVYDQSFFSKKASESREPFPETNVFAVTGPGTAFGDGKEQPMSLKDVPRDAILIVEVRESGISWPAPGDFDIRTMPRTIGAGGMGISGRYPGGFHVGFADGVWFLSDSVPFEALEKFFTVSDAKRYDREKLLGPYVLERGQ